MVMYGELCSEPLMPKNFEFYNPDEHKEIIALLEEKNPVAIIIVNPYAEHVIQDGDFNIPCAIVDIGTLDVFLQSADKTESMIMELAENVAGFEKVEPYPMGDHMIFGLFKAPAYNPHLPRSI